MKRLAPDKRNKLIGVMVVTIALISLVYIYLIKRQDDQNDQLRAETKTEAARLETIKRTIKQAGDNASKAGVKSALLDAAEADMASGDVFAWTYDTMRQFKLNRNVDIITMSQPVESDVDLIPSFPYKQIKFQIVGAGYYDDIGKFVADLENKFPHLRVLNLSLDSNAAADAASEKLTFRMDIAALIKPNT